MALPLTICWGGNAAPTNGGTQRVPVLKYLNFLFIIESTGRPTPLKGGVVFFLLEGHPVLSAVFWAPGADTIPGGVLTMKHEKEKKPKKRAEISDDPVPALSLIHI